MFPYNPIDAIHPSHKLHKTTSHTPIDAVQSLVALNHHIHAFSSVTPILK